MNIVNYVIKINGKFYLISSLERKIRDKELEVKQRKRYNEDLLKIMNSENEDKILKKISENNSKIELLHNEIKMLRK